MKTTESKLENDSTIISSSPEIENNVEFSDVDNSLKDSDLNDIGKWPVLIDTGLKHQKWPSGNH